MITLLHLSLAKIGSAIVLYIIETSLFAKLFLSGYYEYLLHTYGKTCLFNGSSTESRITEPWSRQTKVLRVCKKHFPWSYKFISFVNSRGTISWQMMKSHDHRNIWKHFNFIQVKINMTHLHIKCCVLFHSCVGINDYLKTSKIYYIKMILSFSVKFYFCVLWSIQSSLSYIGYKVFIVHSTARRIIYGFVMTYKVAWNLIKCT